MPKEEKNFKRKVRERIARTGESYVTARRNLESHDVAQRDVPPSTPSARQFLYIKTLEHRSGGRRITSTIEVIGIEAIGPRFSLYPYTQASTRELWIAPDGAGRMRATREPQVTWLTSEGEATFAASQAVSLPSGKTQGDLTRSGATMVNDASYGNAGGLIYPYNDGLPDDPVALREAVVEVLREQRRARAQRFGDRVPGPDRLGAAALIHFAGDLQAGANASLRKAAIEMIIRDPSTKELGPSTDRIDREGLLIAADDAPGEGTQHQLVFDPSSWRVLEVRGMVIGERGTRVLGNRASIWLDDLPLGSVVQSSTYLEEGVTNSLTSTPDGTAVPRALPPPFPKPRRPAVDGGEVEVEVEVEGRYVARHLDHGHKASPEVWTARFDSLDQARAASERALPASTNHRVARVIMMSQELEDTATGERWFKEGRDLWRLAKEAEE